MLDPKVIDSFGHLADMLLAMKAKGVSDDLVVRMFEVLINAWVKHFMPKGPSPS